ncbi:MAG: hypothetical protein ACYC0M_15590 [Burkholderiales bacterium]
MAEMQVAMRLSLDDLASQPLSAFVDKLKALGPIVSGLSDKLAVLGKSAQTIGDGASGAVKLESALQRLSNTLASLDTKMSAAVDGVLQFGQNAKESAAGTFELATAATSAGNAISTASGKMDAAALSSGRMNTSLRETKGLLAGMVELWAAFKIEKGIKGSVNEASQFQTEVAKMRMLNMPNGQAESMAAAAQNDSRQFKFVSPLDALITRKATMDALANQQDKALIDSASQYAMKASNVLKVAGLQGDQKDIVKNLLSLSEARAQTGNIDQIKHNMDLMTQIYTATGGKVTPKEIDQFVRNFGSGAQTMSDSALMSYASVIDQMKIAGGQGGSGGGGATRAATAFKMMQAYLLGKPMNKQGAEMLMETGIFKPGAVMAGSTTTSANIRKGSTNDAKLAATNVPAFLEKYMPNIMAYTERHAATYYGGKPLASITKEDRSAALQKYIISLGISVTAAQALMTTLEADSRQRMTQQTAIMGRADGVNASQAKLDSTQAEKMKEFTAQVAALKIAVGTSILPALTSFVEKINELVAALAHFSSNHPIFTFLATMGASIGGVVLIVRGLIKVFGPLSGALFGFGKGSTANAAIAEESFGKTGKAATGMADVIKSAFADALVAMRGTLVKMMSTISGFMLSMAGRISIGVAMALHSTDANAGEDAQFAKMKAAHAAFMVMKNKHDAIMHGQQDKFDASQLPQHAGYPTSDPSGLGADVGAQPTAHQRHAAQKMGNLKNALLVDDSNRARKAAQEEIKAFDALQKKQAHHLKTLTDEVNAASDKQNKPQAIRDHWNGIAKELTASGSPAEAAKAVAVGHRLSAQAELDAAKKILAELQQTLREKEKVTAAQVQSGQLTKIQGTDQTIAQQKAAAPGMMSAANSIMQLEQALGQTTGAIQATIAGIQALGQTMTQFQGNVQNTVQGGFQQLFSSMMRGNESWRLMGAQLNNSLLAGMNSAISQTLSQALSQSLGASISGITGAVGGAAQGTGTFLGSLLGGNASGAFSQAGTALSSLFGNPGTASAFGTTVGSAQTAMIAAQNAGLDASGMGTAAAAAGTAASSTGFLSTLAGIFGFASGADNIPNDMVANIHKGEMIIPAAGAEAIRSGKLGAQGHTVHMNIHAMDSQSVMGAMVGIKRELAGMLGATNTNLNMG